jgi:hypothetical protein
MSTPAPRRLNIPTAKDDSGPLAATDRGAVPPASSSRPAAKKGSVTKRDNSPRNSSTKKDSPRVSSKGKDSPRSGALSARTTTTPRGKTSKKSSVDKPADAKAKNGVKAEPLANPLGGSAKLKPAATPLEREAALLREGSSKDVDKKDGDKKGKDAAAAGQGKKADMLTEELLKRKPLDDKSRDALEKKCGPAKQEVHFERNEGKRPVGRLDELTPSRHERIPPTHIVLMFNCYEASFTLAAGDISSLPEAENCDLRSLTSGKVLGRVKITAEKGTRRRAARAVRAVRPVRAVRAVRLLPAHRCG